MSISASTNEYNLGLAVAWYSLGYLGPVLLPGEDEEIDLALLPQQLPAIVAATDKTAEEYLTYIPLPHAYQVWIRQPQQETYVVVLFFTDKFLQGFRDACTENGIDFRLLVLGLPMKRVKDEIVYYTWRGYDFKQYHSGNIHTDSQYNIVDDISPIAREGLYQNEQPENHDERPGSVEEPV